MTYLAQLPDGGQEQEWGELQLPIPFLLLQVVLNVESMCPSHWQRVGPWPGAGWEWTISWAKSTNKKINGCWGGRKQETRDVWRWGWGPSLTRRAAALYSRGQGDWEILCWSLGLGVVGSRVRGLVVRKWSGTWPCGNLGDACWDWPLGREEREAKRLKRGLGSCFWEEQEAVGDLHKGAGVFPW